MSAMAAKEYCSEQRPLYGDMSINQNDSQRPTALSETPKSETGSKKEEGKGKKKIDAVKGVQAQEIV